MSSARKKVIVRKFSRDWLSGYVAPSHFVQNGQVEILDLAGKVISMPLDEVKWLCFVRDFNSGEAGNPERLLRKSFAGRPRTEGLWLRLKMKDEDTVEGLATNDVTLIDPAGIFLIPPDIRSNTQRIFVPGSAIAELEILAVITSPSKRKPAETLRQEDLFSQED
jgi:hypothetical protein